MFGTDFSRLGELFYSKKGTPTQKVSLDGFISDAIRAYDERNFGIMRGNKRFFYPGQNAFIKIDLVYTPSGVDIPAINFGGKINNIGSVLKDLKGHLEAEYRESDDSTLKERFPECFQAARSRTGKNKKTDFLQAGILALFFTQPNMQDCKLRRAVLQKKEGRFLVEYTPLKLEQVSLDEWSRDLIKNASKITVRDSFYLNRDRGAPLINETVTIVDNNMNYEVRTASGEGLPSGIHEKIKGMFDIIYSRFNLTSYKRVEIEDLISGVAI